jgi:diacylglycerol kinase (ATP)
MRHLLIAMRGIAGTAQKERHMRIHLCFAFYVILAGFVTRLTVSEWMRVLFCIALVCALECLNTALESACDRITTQADPSIRFAKDAAAGAVLIAAVFSAVIGCLTFFRAEKFEETLGFARDRPYAALGIVLLLIPWCIFIFRRQKREDQKNGTKMCDDHHLRPPQRG